MAKPIVPIPKENYYDGQLLQVGDFTRERDYHIANRELFTSLAYAPGVLSGLTVAVDPGNAAGIRIASGAAVDANGSLIVAADRATFAGTTLAAQSGSFGLDLSAAQYYDLTRPVVWQLTAAFAEPSPAPNSAVIDAVPVLALAPSTTVVAPLQIPLANVTVTATSTPSTTAGQKPVITVTVAVDTSVRATASVAPGLIGGMSASSIASGTLDAARIPGLDAAKITSGALDAARIPAMDAAKIASGALDAARIPSLDAAKIASGTLDAARVPSLDAAKIASGTLDAARIPSLDAGKMTSGVLDAARVPSLDAAKIASGTLDVARLPQIPAAKIEGGGGPASAVQTVWADGVAVYPSGSALLAVSQAASAGGFFVGGVRTRTAKGITYYALGIGLAGKLLSFDSRRLAQSGLKVNVYSERTAYDLVAEGGDPADSVASVTFVGAGAYTFDLLAAESSLPPASQGKIRSLVIVGTAKADATVNPPRGAAAIYGAIRDAASPFTFAALLAPASVPLAPTPDAAAQQLASTGANAAGAAQQIAGRWPALAGDPAQLIALLTAHFPATTATPVQMGWALSAAGVDPAKGSAALGTHYGAKLAPAEFLALSLGAFPSPSAQAAIVAAQVAATPIADVVTALKTADPQYASYPAELALVLRVSFPQDVATDSALAAAMQQAGYSRSDVSSALSVLASPA